MSEDEPTVLERKEGDPAFQVEWGETPAGPVVRLHIVEASTRFLVVMRADLAITIGEGLTSAGRNAKSGLIVPQNGHIPPMGPTK